MPWPQASQSTLYVPGGPQALQGIYNVTPSSYYMPPRPPQGIYYMPQAPRAHVIKAPQAPKGILISFGAEKCGIRDECSKEWRQ